MRYIPLALVIVGSVLLIRKIQKQIDLNSRELTPWRQQAWSGEPKRYHYSTHQTEAERRRLALAAEDNHAA